MNQICAIFSILSFCKRRLGYNDVIIQIYSERLKYIRYDQSNLRFEDNYIGISSIFKVCNLKQIMYMCKYIMRAIIYLVI